MLTGEATALLVARARRGEAPAFAELVRAHLRAATLVAMAIMTRSADAEDVAQDAFLIAFERLEDCREPERFAGWLMQIVRNTARNALDRRRLRDVPSDPALPERAGEAPRAEQVGLRARLLAALARVPAEQREVVLLHDLEGWTHAEIGQALEISELMSRQHLFQARRVLRGLLADDGTAEVDHG